MFFRKKENKENTETAIISEIEKLSDKIDSLQKSVRNNSDTISDFIDETDEGNSHIKELEKSEQGLLDIIASYTEQLDMFYNGVNHPDNREDIESHIAWERQLFLAMEQIDTQSKLCGIQRTGIVGEKTDYRIHDIIDVVDTEEEENHELVAGVYSQGIIYKGKVLRKAKVAVYKYQG